MKKIKDYKELLQRVSECKSKIEVRQNPDKFKDRRKTYINLWWAWL